MAYLMVHLTIANKILEKYPDIDDKNAFRIGSIAPDAIGFRPGKRYEKALSHFCIGDESWGYYTNYDEWFDNLICNINKLYSSVNKDFLLGYMSHVIADIENSRRFWTPIRLTNDDKHKENFFNDCYETDSILLSKIENIDDFWEMIDNRNNYFLPDICAAEDIVYMVEIMKSQIYSNRQPNSEYSPSIFTMQTAMDFIDDIVDKTINVIEELKIKC